MTTENDQYTAALDEIRSTSEALNRAGDEATAEIEELESRLVDVEPGVTAWGAELLSEPCEITDDDGGDSQTAKRTVTVGFGRRKKKWGFLVREVIAVKQKPRDRDFTLVTSDEVSALRKADRRLRMLALPQLGGVVDAVLSELRDQAGELLPAPEPEAAEEAGDGTEAAAPDLDMPVVNLAGDDLGAAAAS